MDQASATRAIWAMATVLVMGAAEAQTSPPAVMPATRGALLYETHCIACHNSQVHWRDRKLATDWDSLKTQVRQWQATARLGWTEADVEEVSRHLNDAIYRFTQTAPRLTWADPASR